MIYLALFYSLLGFMGVGTVIFLLTLKRRKVSEPKMSNAAMPAKVRLGGTLGFEITAINKEGTAQVIVARGRKRKWRKATNFTIKYTQNELRTYFLNHTAIWADKKLHYLRDYEVPVDETGNFVFEDWNELELTDSGLNQFSEALGNLLKFQFTRNIITGMIIAGVIGIEIGLSFIGPDTFPNTVVHWLTNKPVGFP